MKDDRVLFESQRAGARQALRILLGSDQKGVLIWSDAGTGKTFVSIKVLEGLYNYDDGQSLPTGPVLIFPKSSHCEHWRRDLELRGWTVQMPRSKKEILKLKTYPNVNKHAVIISVTSCGRDEIKKHLFRLGKAVPWFAMLVDEAHELPNRASATAKALCGRWLGKKLNRRTENYWDSAKYRLILTGTPFGTSIANSFHWLQRALGGSPTNVENIPKALNSAISDYYTFAEKYCYYKDSDYGRQYYGCREKEGFAALAARVCIRDMLPELPPKIVVIHKLSSELSISEYKSDVSKAELLSLAKKLIEDEDPAVPEHIATERHDQGEKKIIKVSDLTRDLLEEGKPTILFGVHQDVIQGFTRRLRKYKPLVIDGKVKGTERQRRVDQFQAGETNLLIVQIRTGGTGFTITRATDIVIGELDWNPDAVSQAIARAYRIGLKHVLTVHFPLVLKSLDTYIFARVKQKMKLNQEILELIVRGINDSSCNNNL